MPIQVKYTVETPSYEQLKAWLLANGWEIICATDDEWRKTEGVFLCTWRCASALTRFSRHTFDYRVQDKSRSERDTEDYQTQKAIEHVSAVMSLNEYDLWLSIVTLDNQSIEKE